MGVGLNLPLPLVKCTVTRFVSVLAEQRGGMDLVYCVS